MLGNGLYEHRVAIADFGLDLCRGDAEEAGGGEELWDHVLLHFDRSVDDCEVRSCLVVLRKIGNVKDTYFEV
jgi:hypothetical protein